MNQNKMIAFSQLARQALSQAQAESEAQNLSVITVRHLLIGLASMPRGISIASHVLNGLGLTVDRLRDMPEPVAVPQANETTQRDLSTDVKRTLEHAVAIARKRRDVYIDTAHLLAGALQTDACQTLFADRKVGVERIRSALESLDIWQDGG